MSGETHTQDPHRVCLDWLLRGLAQAYDDAATSDIEPLLHAIEGVDAELADWRAVPNQHTIRELVGHVAAWKWFVVRHLRGEPIEGPATWSFQDVSIDLPVPGTWEEVGADLKQVQAALVQEISKLTDARLGEPAGSRTLGQILTGMVGHDSYHAGQIVVLRRQWEATHR